MDNEQVISKLVGNVITRISMVYYTFDTESDTTHGNLQLTLCSAFGKNPLPPSDTYSLVSSPSRARVSGHGSGASLSKASLNFEHVLLFRTGSDGQSLELSEEPWSDPFSEPLSEENRSFVKSSGKWSIFEVSTSEEYAPLIGKKITKVYAIKDIANNLRGARLVADNQHIIDFVEWDEGQVSTFDDNEQLASLNFHLEPITR